MPALVFLGFPAHFATAMSHFVLAFSSGTSFIMHLISGVLTKNAYMAFSVAAGAVAGAQAGAVLKKKIKGSVIYDMPCRSFDFSGREDTYIRDYLIYHQSRA